MNSTSTTFPYEPRRTALLWVPAWVGYCLAFTVIGLVYAVSKTIQIMSDRQYLSQEGVCKRDGLLFSKTQTIPYSDIQHIGFKQNKLEEYFGYGNLYIISTKGTAIVFRFLREPKKVEQIIISNMPN